MKRGLLFFCMAICYFTAMAQLNGTYTINQNLATSGTNYKYFSHAILALQQSGVSGPVVFDVVRGSGPYVEQIKIDSVAGASATNTVTFRGNGEILTYAPFNPIKRHIIRLSGAKHLVFEDLMVKVDDAATYDWCVQCKNGCDSVRFSDCVVVSKSDSNKSTYVCFAGSNNDSDLNEFATSPAVQNTTIENSVVLYGAYSFFNSGYHYGLSIGNYPMNVAIENNLLYRYNFDGVLLNSNGSPVVKKNFISSYYNKYSAEHGIYLHYGQWGYNLSDNYLFMAGSKGIESFLTNEYTPITFPGIIANNMIGGIQYDLNTDHTGLHLHNLSNLNAVNNWVNRNKEG